MVAEKKVILSVRNLCKDFVVRSKKITEPKKILHALSDVSFDIYEGEILGVIGESGCGKSTLGRCLVQLHTPTAGQMLYHDKDLLAIKGKEKKALCKDIQMVFQDPYSSLDPRKTVSYSIGEPIEIHDKSKTKTQIDEIVLDLLQQVGLDMQHMHRFPHEFSGGQRQRVNIARALAVNPKLIVCDEPVSALDVSIQAQVINLFKNLQKKFNLTYIFISHDLGIVKYISDRILIMYLGRVVELASADALYKEPLHPYTKALLSAIPSESPFEKKERLVLKGDIPSPIGEQIGCPLAGRCPKCMERCKNEIPVLKNRGNNHHVACFLYDDN